MDAKTRAGSCVRVGVVVPVNLLTERGRCVVTRISIVLARAHTSNSLYSYYHGLDGLLACLAEFSRD